MFAPQYIQDLLARAEVAERKIIEQAKLLVEKDAEIARLQAELDNFSKARGNKD